MATTFTEAMSRTPVKAFQWITVTICMLILVCDGIDMQLLGIVAPVIIEEFSVDRGFFGIAMSAALVGMGLGAWAGGWLGDLVGRRYSLAIAALSFGLATIAASFADGVWSMAILRLLGGLGFGAAYANSLAMASEWLPDKWRAIAITTLSVGTPAGGTVAAALAPSLLADFGWRGSFIIFGAGTLFLLVLILLVLRDSPSFHLSKNRPEEANKIAKKVLDGPFELKPDEESSVEGGSGERVGVLHSSNKRMNIGVGLIFAASTMVAYGILNWSTSFLTVAGFGLEQAAYAVSVAGMTSIAGAISAGVLTRLIGSRKLMVCVSIVLMMVLLALAFTLDAMPEAASDAYRTVVIALIGSAAALFSGGIATIYVIMANGYQQSCRSAGIGFGIFMSRVGAVGASLFGGALIDAGDGSLFPFFAVLIISAGLIFIATFVVDRHVAPTRSTG